MATTEHVATQDPRIPVELQQVFLKSNRGEEVTSAPRSAFRVFKRSLKWLPRRTKKNKKKKAAKAAASPVTLKTTHSSDSDSDNKARTSIPTVLDSIFMPSNGAPELIPNKEKQHSSRIQYWKKLFVGASHQDSSRRRLFQKEQSSSTTPLALASMTDLSVTDYTDYLDPTETSALQVVKSTVSPQSFVDAMIYESGYSTRRYKALHSAYYNRSTALQQASFRGHLIDLAKIGNTKALRRHLQCGLSCNPANAYGESLVHKICRMGRAQLLRVLMHEFQVDIRIADEHGRTPLHEACAANSLECFEMICEQDLRMLYLSDHLGMVPLEFVPKQAWMDWIVFLQAKKDEYWPQGVFERGQEEPAPLLALQPPHSRQLQDPPNALPLDVASRVASGELKPELAQEEKSRQLANRPMLGHLIANLDDLDNLSDLDDESYFSDSESEQEKTSLQDEDSLEDEMDGESEISELDDDDDDDDVEDDDSHVSNSMDLEAMGEAMMVLGISPRAALDLSESTA